MSQPDVLALLPNYPGEKHRTMRFGGLGAINKNPDDWEFSNFNNEGKAVFINIYTGYILEIKPRYAVGDRLYVKETWRTCCPDKHTRHHIAYRATQDSDKEKWKPSIFMPKWAARIWLPCTKVTVQRPQELSEEECIAEGLERTGGDRYWLGYDLHKILGTRKVYGSPKDAWKSLYISVYGEEKWNQNLWHFVYWWEEIEVK